MDDQTQITACGNQTLSEGLEKRPLVTFALFSYNQEQYIREAVEGAFSQTYSPLEIILSDDCSSDRTFEIMEDMARGYQGPHLVKVRRNSVNLGTSLNVQLAFRESHGALFVVAAGDDISLPHRVEEIFKRWEQGGKPIGVVHSGWESFIDGVHDSSRVFPAKTYPFSGNEILGYSHSFWLPAAAPTCAYTRELFDNFPPLLGGSIIEDAPLFLRAALTGKFLECHQALVRTRTHSENSGTGYTLESPSRWNRFIQSKMVAFRTMQIDLIRSKHMISPTLHRQAESRILAVIRSASILIVPEGRNLTQLEKLILAVRLISSPAVAPSFKIRLVFALEFFGYRIRQNLKKSLWSTINKPNKTT